MSDFDERIARIHRLLEAMRTTPADAREEALTATEQLLQRARHNHAAVVEQSRVNREQSARDRTRREDAAQSAFRTLQQVIKTSEGTDAKPAKKEPR